MNIRGMKPWEGVAVVEVVAAWRDDRGHVGVRGSDCRGPIVKKPHLQDLVRDWLSPGKQNAEGGATVSVWLLQLPVWSE